jgi:KaiC/GvpD/RAD55 family RecA-like ATPase
MSALSLEQRDRFTAPEIPTFVRALGSPLPAELREFATRPGPQSILVRGPPGAGKTSLGLALLEAFSGERILVTERVSEPELRRDFPWFLPGGTEPIQIVNAMEHTRGLAESAAAVNSMSGIINPASRDALGDFLLLPDAVQVAFACIDPKQPVMVVIDSWDALVEAYMARGPADHHGMANREDIERLLLGTMQRSEVTLVLILEREEQSQLDYLVIAVVSTEKQMVEGRLERRLYIPKLRGQRLETPSYPYTLEGAKFQPIPPIRSGNTLHGAPAPWHGEASPRPRGREGASGPGGPTSPSLLGVSRWERRPLSRPISGSAFPL